MLIRAVMHSKNAGIMTLMAGMVVSNCYTDGLPVDFFLPLNWSGCSSMILTMPVNSCSNDFADLMAVLKAECQGQAKIEEFGQYSISGG